MKENESPDKREPLGLTRPDEGSSEPLLDHAADWLEGGVALLDSARRITFLSEELAAWIGAPVQDLLDTPFEQLLLRHCPEAEASLARAWAESGPWKKHDFPAGPASEGRWLRLEAARNESGWFVRLNSTVPPLRERIEAGSGGHPDEDPEKRQMRLRLSRAESQLEKLIQRWPGVLFSQRADFSFRFVSSQIEELTGVPVEEWRSRPRRFWEVVHEADVEELDRQCRQAARTPAGVTTTYRVRHVVTGKVSYILEHRQAAVSRSGLVLGYEGVWLDVSRQTIAEKRLSAAAWKETLALLTMGLAHDFNNVMSGILSLSELILTQIGSEHPCASSLELVKESSLQASQLVQRIMNLHRSKVGVRQYHDLNSVVSELVELVCMVLPRRIRVRTELAPRELPIYLDAVEFRQVVLNLALNAADAMPDRGELVFRVTPHSSERRLEHFQGKFPRLPCACLSVQDNGTGISARHLPHVFDPFFTTKALSKGSGLGLYNARLFVESHGGAISVDSTEGQGATFYLWLPEADFTEAERAASQKGGSRRGVLLVGEPGLAMDSMAEFLRTHGCYVVATHSSPRALELLATEEHQLHCVFVLANPGETALLEFIPDLRKRRLNKHIVLQLLGGNADQVETRILDQADLVLGSNAEEGFILRKVDTLFATKTEL